MALVEKGILIKQSRISYIYNYSILALAIIFFMMVWSEYGLTFTLFPSSFDDLWRSGVSLLFLLIFAFLLEEPEIRRWITDYKITNNEVIEITGLIRKKRTTIPFQTIASVNMDKGVMGRIFDFGDINVKGFKDEIDMKGIREPETFYRIINNKISLVSGGKHKVVPEGELDIEQSPKDRPKEDWKDTKRSMETRGKIDSIRSTIEEKAKGMEIFGMKILASDDEPVERELPAGFKEEFLDDDEAVEPEKEIAAKKRKKDKQ